MNDKKYTSFDNWIKEIDGPDGSDMYSKMARKWAKKAWLAAKEKYEPRWLTIESAPKKHTEILVCNMRQGATMTLVYYKTLYGTWMCKGEPINMQATHWMPLPPIPSAPSTQGGGE